MYKNYIIVIVSLFMLAIGLQVWAQNTDILNIQDEVEDFQVAQTQEAPNTTSEQNEPQETTTQDSPIQETSVQEKSVSVSDVVTSPVNTGSEQEVPIGTVVDTGVTAEPIVGTSDIVSQPVLVDQAVEHSETPRVIFANPRTGTEVINGQFVKKTEMNDLSPQAQDFVASILK